MCNDTTGDPSEDERDGVGTDGYDKVGAGFVYDAGGCCCNEADDGGVVVFVFALT